MVLHKDLLGVFPWEAPLEMLHEEPGSFMMLYFGAASLLDTRVFNEALSCSKGISLQTSSRGVLQSSIYGCIPRNLL